tara:strand:+ start:695 stop:1558 length:864 start_codon:yes stop_codon:yes gene_type:complete
VGIIDSGVGYLRETFTASKPYKGGEPGFYTDYSDTLANQHGLYLDIYALHAKARVQFKAFLTSFQDSFDTSLDVQTFVGHAEPVRKMRAVDRQIQIGLDLPAGNAFQAKVNLRNLGLLVKMVYPLVDHSHVGSGPGGWEVQRAHVKAGGDPIFKVKFKNLITGPNVNPRGPAAIDGLKGYIGNINYSFDLPSGFFHDIDSENKSQTGFIYPQLINLSFTFFPFNEQMPAWSMSTDESSDGKGIRFTRANYPYAHTGEGDVLLNSWSAANTDELNRVNEALMKQIMEG